MKKIETALTVLLISLFSLTIHAQQTHTLKGTAAHQAGKKVELLDFYGDKNRIVSSTIVDKDGLFRFSFAENSPVGMYRLKFENGRNVNVIYNHKDIELSITKPNIQAGRFPVIDGIEVLSAGDTRIYYGFLRTLDLRRKRTAHLNQLKHLYSPSKDRDKVSGQNTTDVREAETVRFRTHIEEELSNIHKGFESYIQKLIKDNPDSFAVNIIKTTKTELNFKVAGGKPRRLLSGDERREWIKEHFWDNMDLSDETLLRSPVIPSKITEYISLYKNDKLERAEREIAYIESVDVILLNASVNDAVFGVVLDIVTRRFEQSEFELVLTYITENYILPKSGCEDSEGVVSKDRAAELREKVAIIKKMAVGNPAPEIEMPQQGFFDLNVSEGTVVPASGSQMKLSGMSSENTLVVFWASWCPHCSTLLSALKPVYEEYRDVGLEVLAISIDTDQSAWQNAISQGQYRWINYSELSGWNGKAAKDYGVWSTPRMYLLDSEERIIARPANVAELKESLAPLKSFKTE